MTDISHRPEYDDEIDLVELISNLWQEKWVIVIATIATFLMGIGYLVVAKPVYQAESQLLFPTPDSLAPLNLTPHYQVGSKQAFAEFVEILSSNTHIANLATKENELLQQGLSISTDNISFENLDKNRTISFPNTTKKDNEIQPDDYTFIYQGFNRNALGQLLEADLLLAQQTTQSYFYEQYKNSLRLKIEALSREQSLSLQKIEDRLAARKQYVLAARKDRLRQLQEALKIAKALSITTPTSLAKLATSNISKQVEISAELNNNQDPLYLRGTRLLTAEIENLESLENDVFLDEQIRQLEVEKQLLQVNRDKEQLEMLLTDAQAEKTINFFSPVINNPDSPIKPKKRLVLAISILLGGMIGFFIAIGRIIYKNYQTKQTESNAA